MIYASAPGTVNLWTVTGYLMQSSRFNAPEYSINAPASTGVYLLEVQLDEEGEGLRRVFNIVVQ